MEFGQFLTKMTLMPTLESVGLGSKVVDLEKLHRFEHLPAWMTTNFRHPEELQRSNSLKFMEFGQFLTKMTPRVTSESVGLAGKVVDLENLHRYD